MRKWLLFIFFVLVVLGTYENSTMQSAINLPVAELNATEIHATFVADAIATNEAAAATANAMWTQVALTPVVPTATPSMTPTSPPTPTPTPHIENLAPSLVFSQGVVNLRTCASTKCNVGNQVQTGTALTLTGWTNGEAVRNTNTMWYRVDYEGITYFVYSVLVASTPPTPTPYPTLAPYVYPTTDWSSYSYTYPTYEAPSYSFEQLPTIPARSPTAICRDGTYSYSSSRRGTCSHHGGVDTWLR